MRLKASTEYGMRTVLYLAEKGGIVSSRAVAEDMCIPRDYLIQLAQLLRNAGIIEARPGKNGGYGLAKDPQKISVLDVMNALSDERKGSSKRKRSVSKKKNELTRSIVSAYGMVESSIEAHMAAMSIAMLLEYMHGEESENEFLSRKMIDCANNMRESGR